MKETKETLLGAGLPDPCFGLKMLPICYASK